MNKYTVLIGIILCIATVTARHYGDRSEADSSDDRDDQDSVRRSRERGANQMRHRRRSHQMNYGYEYAQPPNPYYIERREYDQNQELIPQIVRLLDDISSHVKRPQIQPQPLPPQVIYVPYPVAYPVPQQCNCRRTRPNPNVTSRFPIMEDTNQNWGFADIYGEVNNDDDSDETRPISFVPVVPKRRPKRPPPKVEHGSTQGQASVEQVRVPGSCEVFALSCCSGTAEEQRDCFVNFGCTSTYDNGNACSQDKLLSIIDGLSKAYSPVN